MEEVSNHALLSEIKKLASDMSGLRIDVQSGFSELNIRLERVEKNVLAIRNQTGSLTERIRQVEDKTIRP